MKALAALLIAAGLTTAANAQYVVTNPISDVLDEIMHLEDIAKTVEMINNQVQQINENLSATMRMLTRHSHAAQHRRQKRRIVLLHVYEFFEADASRP